MLAILAAWLVLPLPNLANGSRLTPPVLPLMVRNPYLSAWLSHAREEPWEHWPQFWTGRSIGFSVMASVGDGQGKKTSYPLLGRPQDSLRGDDEA